MKIKANNVLDDVYGHKPTSLNLTKSFYKNIIIKESDLTTLPNCNEMFEQLSQYYESVLAHYHYLQTLDLNEDDIKKLIILEKSRLTKIKILCIIKIENEKPQSGCRKEQKQPFLSSKQNGYFLLPMQ